MKPLHGITAIDFTQVLSGPYCTMMLADQGARVIKIERPDGGDSSRGYGPFYDNGVSVYYSFVNRGKESIALDLKDPKALAIVKRMIASADIVVENFRPGVMSRLGLAPEELVKQYPRLIVCSISGFGQTGPMSRDAAYDTVIQAMSGAMSVTGDPDPQGHPTRMGTSIADLSAGLYAYAAIMTALAARERTGKGSAIDIAMLDSLFSLLEHGLMDALAEHINPTRIGNRHPSIAPFDTFKCQDRLLAICCGNDKLFQRLCDLTNLTQAKNNLRFQNNEKRFENQTVLKQMLEEVLKTDTAEAWNKKLSEGGIPTGIVQTVEEARDLEQLQVRGMIADMGGQQVPGNPLHFSIYESSIASTPPPALDAQGEQLRQEFSL